MSGSEIPSRCSLYDRLTSGLDNEPNYRDDQEMTLKKRVGFYKLRTQLGTGSFSKVKLGIHLLTNECVAVKVIDKTGLDEKALRLLPQEIACMEKLNHPNLVRLYEVIETFSTLHLVMEYAGHVTLQRKVMEEGPFTEQQARHTFSQLLSAISYMHENNMVHRDIKAENIFIKDQIVKLGDFGFSTNTHPSRLLTTFCGSPLYAAPELFTADGYHGRPVDVWALGVTLYFTLTSQLPFLGSNLEQVKSTVVKGEFSVPGNLSSSCKQLIGGLLERDVSKRLTLEAVWTYCAWLGEGTSGDKTQSCLSLDRNSSYSDVRMSISAGSGDLDEEVVQDLKTIGLPVGGVDFSEEPRSCSVGTYRILLRRKHSEAWESSLDLVGKGLEQGACVRGRTPEAQDSQKRKTSHQHKKSKYCTIL